MTAKTWAALVAVMWWHLHALKAKRKRRGSFLSSHVKQAHELRVARYREGRERLGALLLLFPVVTQ
jgi:hypothetical protein